MLLPVVLWAQSSPTDSLFKKFQDDISIEQTEYTGVVHLDDETKRSYYTLLDKTSDENLLKYMDDLNPAIRGYIFLGLARTKIDERILQTIISKHNDDSAGFITKSADVVLSWTVVEYMKMIFKGKSEGKLKALDYQEEIRKIDNTPKILIKGVSHNIISKSDLLKIDSLNYSAGLLIINSFDLVTPQKSIKATGKFLTEEMKNLILDLDNGDVLVFDNIKASDPEGRPRTIQPFYLKVLN